MFNFSCFIVCPLENDTAPVLNKVPDYSRGLNIHAEILMKYPLLVYSIVAFYIVFVKWIGPAVMRRRQPYRLKKVLIAYNLFQAIANFYIAYFVIDGVIKYWDSRCVIRNNPKLNEMLEVASVLGYHLYVIKFIDLLDTVVFFVLRKKPVSARKAFQHASRCLIFHWGLSNIHKNPRFCVAVGLAINTVVHVIMHTYKGLAATGRTIQKYLWRKKHLIHLKFGQNFFILGYVIFELLTGCEEFGDLEACALIYGSLMVAFATHEASIEEMKKSKRT